MAALMPGTFSALLQIDLGDLRRGPIRAENHAVKPPLRLDVGRVVGGAGDFERPVNARVALELM